MQKVSRDLVPSRLLCPVVRNPLARQPDSSYDSVVHPDEYGHY
jgi:hypothetical protein